MPPQASETTRLWSGDPDSEFLDKARVLGYPVSGKPCRHSLFLMRLDG